MVLETVEEDFPLFCGWMLLPCKSLFGAETTEINFLLYSALCTSLCNY